VPLKKPLFAIDSVPDAETAPALPLVAKSITLVPAPQALGVTPNPKLPALSNLAHSAPPSAKAMVSAAGKKMPVFASVPLIAGVAAVPSTSDSPSVPERISDRVMLL